MPVLTEDEVPGIAIPSTTSNDLDFFPAAENHRVAASRGRRSSESEFRWQSGNSRNFVQPAEKPGVDVCNLLMQRSMSLGSAVQPSMSTVLHGHRLSTASDAHSTHSSSSGSTNGVRSSLDLSTGSSARSTEVFPGYIGSSVKDDSAVRQAKAKSKSLPRDVPPLPSGASSLLQPWHRDERSEVNCYSDALYSTEDLLILFKIKINRYVKFYRLQLKMFYYWHLLYSGELVLILSLIFTSVCPSRRPWFK